MAASDASVFPPLNAAFRIPVSFRDTSGAIITGWTGAASVVVVDGASLGAGGTPTEVGSTGLGFLDLTNTQMNGKLVQVKCTVTNTNATPFVAFIYTGGVIQMQAGLATAAEVSAIPIVYHTTGRP